MTSERKSDLRKAACCFFLAALITAAVEWHHRTVLAAEKAAPYIVTIAGVADTLSAQTVPSVSMKGADWLYLVWLDGNGNTVEVYTRDTVLIEPAAQQEDGF